jgi:hypothetical protein
MKEMSDCGRSKCVTFPVSYHVVTAVGFNDGTYLHSINGSVVALRSVCLKATVPVEAYLKHEIARPEGRFLTTVFLESIRVKRHCFWGKNVIQWSGHLPALRARPKDRNRPGADGR